MFRVRVDREINGTLYTRQTAYDDVVPGIPIRLHNDGTYDPPEQYWDDGTFTITYENLHRMYVCQSWKDSVTLEGNEQVAMVPFTQPFSAIAIVDADDFADYDDVSDITPGTAFAIINGLLAAATATNPPVLQVLSNPKSMFNDEYEVEFATWGLRLQP